MSFSRTLTSTLRTGRSAWARPNGVNPVQHILRSDRVLARNYAAVFERTKPHVNIGMFDLGLPRTTD